MIGCVMTRKDTKNKRRKYGAASWWSSQIHSSHAASSFILVLAQPFVMSSVCSTIVCACSAFTTRLAARQCSTERPAPLLPELLLHLWWRSHSVILTLARMSLHCFRWRCRHSTTCLWRGRRRSSSTCGYCCYFWNKHRRGPHNWETNQSGLQPETGPKQ